MIQGIENAELDRDDPPWNYIFAPKNGRVQSLESPFSKGLFSGANC